MELSPGFPHHILKKREFFMKYKMILNFENDSSSIPFELQEDWKKEISGNGYKALISLIKKEGKKDIWEISFSLLSGSAKGYLALEFEEENWSPENYILMPAAVYNGNRVNIFTEKHIPLTPPDFRKLAPPQMTGLVHHLAPEGGGEIELMSGEYAFPSMGCFFRTAQESCWILTPQKNEMGDFGYCLKEEEKGKSLKLKITTPCQRKLRQRGYKLIPSEDPAGIFSCGMEVKIEFALIHSPCGSMKEFFHQAFLLRNHLLPAGETPDLYPISQAAELLRKRMETDNYREEYGYYTIVTLDYLKNNPGYKLHYTLAWMGGSMKLENIFREGSKEAMEHGKRELEFLFRNARQKSGFLYTVCHEGTFLPEWYPGDPVERKSCIVRKNAEGFASLMRQIRQWKERGEEVPVFWYEGMKDWAEAFHRLWQKYHQFGYLLDPETGEITLGGGAGGIAAATGLAMASEFFQEERFLETAREAVLHYAANDLAKGVVYGGVGDAFQATDSESAYMLLEALITVWEYAPEPRLLEEAVFAADLLASWCVAYDYGFPPTSTFGKMKMTTTGTVYANIQNRHSAPGFCSASGDALFKLYRATGREEYLLLLQRIIRALPQFVSRADRPIHGLDNDRMNERVNMADWEGKDRMGELFNGSCWPEVSLLLARIHIPGIYVRKDLGKVFSLDHIKGEWQEGKVILSNTTSYDAEATLLAEEEMEMKHPLKSSAYSRFRKIHIPAGGKITLPM